MKKEKQKKKNKPIVKAIKWIFLLLLFCVLAIGINMAVRIIKIRNEAVNLVENGGSLVFKQGLTTTVYDSGKNTIAVLNSEKDAYYMEFDNIPYMVKQVFLITEDRNFYDHSGVDYKSVLRAFVELLKNEGEITQGGSTITQQLARNIYLSHEVSFNRKLKEVFIAWKLEEIYSKDEIFEFYINNIYFANGLYGVQAAARGYFNKDVNELSLSELCYICAIPNNPETYNPLENHENTIIRRNRILKQLLEKKIIDGSEYEEACSEDITLSLSEKIKNNYVETFVRYSATRELMKLKGFEFQYFFNSNEEKEAYTEEYNRVYGECNGMLFTGGYRIYTSIDMEKQKLLQTCLDERLEPDSTVNEAGVFMLQGSAVSIDNNTGYVVAVVGGREQEYDGYTLNRAYQSFRQPGSAIKPLLVYTPLFERGYTPDSQVTDEKISGGPVNSPNVYSGNINIRTALAVSKNTIAWKMFELMGSKMCISYLLNMQFSHIVKQDYVPAMSIGGMTYGVSSLEMASAYATLANDGIYREPTCIVKITDSFGNVIVDNESRTGQADKNVYDKNAALMTTDILKDVLVWGTGKGYQTDNAICAGKTGTTNDNKDTWFAGYSKYYTTVVWCGYDMPKTLEGENIKAAGMIWHDYMEEIHKELKKVDFDMYVKSGIEKNETEVADTPGTSYISDTSEVTDELYGDDVTQATTYIPETSEGDGIYVETY